MAFSIRAVSCHACALLAIAPSISSICRCAVERRDCLGKAAASRFSHAYVGVDAGLAWEVARALPLEACKPKAG